MFIMIAVFLAMGFEEIEALAVVDVLRRAELDVVTIGVGGRFIRGSHGIVVAADIEDSQATTVGLEAVVLPGGLPGTLNLEHSPVVNHFITTAVENNLPICAICAAPSILGHLGLLKGKKAVCFPGYEQELEGAEILNSSVVEDGQFITAKGAGVAIEFALSIVAKLVSKERAEKIRESMQCV
jgi:4-methyl-5(b-hydroxyethyl)-thiazole monophosphate biosynthesis